MRGLISEEPPDLLGVASALRRAVPAVYQEDPLFMQLCAAFDDLIAPLVTAVDCFDAYLNPYLAPPDFLPWLADLVGYQGPVSKRGTSHERTQIAAAVQNHTRRGTALGVREAAARAAGVPLDQVELDDPGGTRWSTIPGGASTANDDWPHTAPRVRVTAPMPSNTDKDAKKLIAAIRAAIEETAGVHCAIAVELTAAGEAARPGRARPPGARSYGGES